MNTALVKGSLSEVSRRTGFSLAESFLSADVICLVDVSGSMDSHDSRGGRSRYVVACEELQALQASMPGKIAVVGFSDSVEFAPTGIPTFQGNSTDLAKALRFVKPADGTVRIIVISDGEPSDPDQCLQLAQTFKSKISCVYVGPEQERYGARFLERLAAMTGGQYVVAAKAIELANRIQKLMITPGNAP